MDTSDISEMVGGRVIANNASVALAANPDSDLLTADASQGSGGVNESEYTVTVGKTALVSRAVTQLNEPLAKLDSADQGAKAKQQSKSRTADARREEDITLIFDRNKGKLYSVYNRALRKNPGLKGKIILQLIIAPNGKVIEIKVLSSDLDDPKLESGLLSRIRLFNFGAKDVEQVTVTYPIEFLPS
jgi:protein TonB